MYAGFEDTYVYQTINEEGIAQVDIPFRFNEKYYTLLYKLNQESDPFDDSAYRETTFLMAYSRKTTEPLNRIISVSSRERKERWFDVVIRVIEGTMSHYIQHMKSNRLNIYEEKIQSMAYNMAVSMYKMHWTPPGRGLFAMGTEHTKRIGNASLNNCYATDVQKNLVKSLVWGMDMLMCGGGVGFSVETISNILRPNKKNTRLVVIPDSREGWCIALELILRAYIPINGKTGLFPIFDYSLIRPYGSPIKGFGGTASGPEPLRILLERVEVFLDTYLNFKVRSHEVYLSMFDELVKRNIYSTCIFNRDTIRKEIIDQFGKSGTEYTMTRLIADIANSIGVCVVSGNVRRSSEILLGDPGDLVFINLKNYELHPLRRPIMYLSNNTIRLWHNIQFDSYLPEIVERMRNNGEPGILNMINIQKYGRFSDKTYGLDSATLVNPCGEIPLNSFEPCCLSCIVPIKCVSNIPFDRKLLDDAIKWATFYTMVVTTIPHHWAVTNKIIQTNRRIGVGMTGSVDFYERFGTTKFITICKSSYKLVRYFNAEFASKMCIRESIRCTTSKPDGTISIVLGCSNGINFPTCRFAKRRVCYDRSNKLLKTIENAGYEIELSTLNDKHSYAIFPICESKSRTEREASLFEKMQLVELIQRHYVDNSVSVTFGFNIATESHLIEQAVAMHIPQMKCMSIFPQYESIPDQYKHIPFENITEEKYKELLSQVRQLNKNELYELSIDADDSISSGCAGGLCSRN